MRHSFTILARNSFFASAVEGSSKKQIFVDVLVLCFVYVYAWSIGSSISCLLDLNYVHMPKWRLGDSVRYENFLFKFNANCSIRPVSD
jgi:hypothetical protein